MPDFTLSANVVDLHGLFDYEGLTVTDADEVAVEAGHGAQTVADLLLIRKQRAAFNSFAVLRRVAQQRRHAPFELRADIHDEGWLHFGINA